ncbi:hypothetical protein [Paludibacterium sp.]|uniref:hypothetical protein n=1 Tax=Paludibacterium sp. TaxID=1917523 RepID=UPI0025F88E56|nr:hypothetical protein [Paludibacterium sp.]MBV8648470.1 hypothetical protein [Paludibacterium sp.]
MPDIPTDILNMHSGQTEGKQFPSTTSEPAEAPSSAPMATPNVKKGNLAVGNAKVRLAMSVLGQALVAYGPDSDESKDLHSVLDSLTSKFGGKADIELIPAQILDLVRNEPSLQKGQPIQQAMQQGQGAGVQQPPSNDAMQAISQLMKGG